jgi:hypothetical protein
MVLEQDRQGGDLSPAERFLLAEYDNLWKEYIRSQESEGTLVRLFLLLVAASAGLATALSTLVAGQDVHSSPWLFQVMGIVGLSIGVIGFLLAVYLAHDLGYRTELAHHLGDIRAYFKELNGRVASHLTLPGPGGPGFLPLPWHGRFAIFSFLSILGSLAILGGSYLLSNAKAVAYAITESTSLPLENLFVPALSFLGSLLLYYLAFYAIGFRWQQAYQAYSRGKAE